MKRFVLLASLIGAAACGDNLDPGGTNNDGPVTIDAPTDAASPDAPTDASEPDAPTDAAAPTFSGTLTILEAQVLAPAPAPANTIAAQGIQLGITFNDSSMTVPPVLDTMPGTLFGCKVTELDAGAEIAAAAGVNEGTVQVTVNNPGDPPSPPNPVFPTCVFIPGGTGYICPDAGSSQAITAVNSVTINPINTSTSRLVVNAGTATFDAQDVGRYVKFSGTGVPTLDASHVAVPIVALTANPNEAIIGTPVMAPVPLVMGMLSTLAGVGPMPGLADPGQLADAASATAVITPGGGNHFPMTTITYSNVGDDFTMDDTNAGRMRSIPTDGSAFTVACATCGTSIGTVLNIVTTDAPVSPQSPFSMPAPVTKRVTIRCAEVGSTSITVPANVSAYIMNSGATRIQATFIRGTFGTPSPQNPGLSSVISGHAMVGFTSPTP